VKTTAAGTTADALDDVWRKNTGPRYERWVDATSWPLLAAALVFLAAYALPILVPDLDQALRAVCRAVVWVTWLLFALDYVVRFVLVPHKRAFFRRHLLDLLFLVLPVLRPLALLRLVTVFLVLDRHAGSRLRDRVGLYVGGGTLLMVFAAALAVLDVERGAPGAKIENFGDAIWWACTTITTVGYGDVYPVTVLGRCIAVGLMLGGVALVGVITASLASWFVEAIVRPARSRAGKPEETEVGELRAEIASLRADIASLRALFLEQGAGEPASGTGNAAPRD
jgi:voltage-gated potassium channel